MAEQKKDSFSTMNLTIVSVIALVAIVSVVALVLAGRSTTFPLSTGGQLVSADAQASRGNVAGQATQSWGGLENDWTVASGGGSDYITPLYKNWAKDALYDIGGCKVYNDQYSDERYTAVEYCVESAVGYNLCSASRTATCEKKCESMLDNIC